MDSVDEYRSPDNRDLFYNREEHASRGDNKDYVAERDFMLLTRTGYPEFSIKYMQEDRLEELALYIKNKYDMDSLLSNVKKLSEIVGRDIKYIARWLTTPSVEILRVKRLIGVNKYKSMSYAEKDIARWVSYRGTVENARAILLYVAVTESLKYE